MGRPRIRYIKPEIWLSRDFQGLTPVGRLTFFALISNADDEGRLKTDPAHLALTFLPGCPVDEIAAQLEVMETRRMAIAYKVRGVRYVALLGWPSHQRVSHSTPSELPAPPKFKRSANTNKSQIDLDFRRRTPEDSRSRARLRSSSSSSSSVTTPAPTTETGPADADLQSLVATVPVRPSGVEEVFEAWRDRWHPTAKLTAQRKAKIQARLNEGWTVQDLVGAVTAGAAADPWESRHVALNDDLTHLLRNGEAAEKFVGLAQRTLSATPSPKIHPFDRYALDTLGRS